MSGAEKVRSRNGPMPPVGTSLKCFNNRNMRWAILFAGLVVSTLLIREYSHAWDTEAGPEGMGVFFTAFGILYAIISAFVLLESLQRFDVLKLVMSDEINALQDIRDLVCYLDGDGNEAVGRDIKRAMLTYVESILDTEWVKLESKSNLDDKDTTVELHDVMTETNKIKVTNPSDTVALRFIISNLMDVTTYRTKRFAITEEETPPKITWLLNFMSVALVAGLILMRIDSLIIHLFMVLAMATAVYLIYYMQKDLNQPFSGDWCIERKEFEGLADSLRPR